MHTPQLYPSSTSAYSGIYDYSIDELPDIDAAQVEAVSNNATQAAQGLFTQVEAFYSKHLLVISMLQSLLIIYLILKLKNK